MFTQCANSAQDPHGIVARLELESEDYAVHISSCALSDVNGVQGAGLKPKDLFCKAKGTFLEIAKTKIRNGEVEDNPCGMPIINIGVKDIH